ncbi:MAG TPA: SRPBCC domain-containing protein [Ramlibacter sp.]
MDRPDERPQLRLARRYPVAPARVWRAWTDPQALSAWFGPGEPNSVTLAELDVRPGGRYRIRFHTPDGEEHEVSGTYEEVVPERKLVFSWAWRSTPERVSRVTLTLEPSGQGTELGFLHERFFDEAARDGHRQGWAATLAKLEAWLQASAADAA